MIKIERSAAREMTVFSLLMQYYPDKRGDWVVLGSRPYDKGCSIYSTKNKCRVAWFPSNWKAVEAIENRKISPPTETGLGILGQDSGDSIKNERERLVNKILDARKALSKLEDLM